MEITCFKCHRSLPGKMFKSQSRSGVTRRVDIPRQCLDCIREWHRVWAEKRRRAKGMPLRSDPVKTAAAKRRRSIRQMARQRTMKSAQRPRWGRECVVDVYVEAKHLQLEVDHIVPLIHPKVCGLHVWDNLQLLTSLQNRRKGNSFDPLTHVHSL